MKRPIKDRTKFNTIVRHLPHGNPDQKWFKAHMDRQYRIRPKRHDEPGKGFVIIKQIYPGCRLLVDVGHEGAMLANTDDVLGKTFGILHSGKAGIVFPPDGSVLSEDEVES